jgi:hypothetical protein
MTNPMAAETRHRVLPRPSDFLITPMDVFRAMRHVWRRAGWYDIVGAALLALLLADLRLMFGFGAEALFFWGFGFVTFYWRRDGRAAVGLGLLCLTTVPLLLALGQPGILIYGEAWAEQMAVWAYYFLIIGVGKQLVDLGVERFRARRAQPAAEEDPTLARFRMPATGTQTEAFWTPRRPTSPRPNPAVSPGRRRDAPAFRPPPVVNPPAARPPGPGMDIVARRQPR